MHDEIFFKECFQCDRQSIYEVKGVKDNYFKCRVKKHILKLKDKTNQCPYYKRRKKDGKNTYTY